ncbi:MAG TPA: hypothetical protein VHP36_01025 [Chitinispirillaceae bacterium]|nr:hypothetical protein [Chitinispirillaceae bacterium]
MFLNKVAVIFLAFMISGSNMISICHSGEDGKADVHFIAQSCDKGDCTRDAEPLKSEKENCRGDLCHDQPVNEKYPSVTKILKLKILDAIPLVFSMDLLQLEKCKTILPSSCVTEKTYPKPTLVLRI